MDRVCCVGVDVAKRHWDAAVHGRQGTRRFVADEAGLAELMAWLEELKPTLVCLEATGGYERLLRQSLHEQGVPVSIVNPRQVRDFARATGQLAKTDAIDATLLARFAATLEPEPSEPPSPQQERLRALRARRQQVVQSLIQERTAWAQCRMLKRNAPFKTPSSSTIASFASWISASPS